MSSTLFISDLHLSPDRPLIVASFFRYLDETVPGADALYILGDLFEYWVGDDDGDEPFNRSIAEALARVAGNGVPVYLMHGNRDVLIGAAFAQRCGAGILADPTMLDLYGTRTLVMHGDTLCTDDHDYQAFRRYARDPETQRKFLALPLGARQRQVLDWRAQSEMSKRRKHATIMDVTSAAVEDTLRRFGYPRLIHGHTHRPARHLHVVDRHTCERWVLSDWYVRGGYLRCDAAGCSAFDV